MDWSNYNRIYKIDEEQQVVYNYANGKAIFLIKALMDIVKQHIESIDEMSDIHPSLYEAFLKNGMIVKNKLEEKVIVKNNIIKTLKSSKVLKLTINPTLDCNLRCWYCYEKHDKSAYMNNDTIHSVHQFVSRRLANETEKVELSFFGGEPLLTARVRAIPLAKDIRDLCMSNGIKISLHFTTNGSLLTMKIVDSIASLNIPTAFQIAFDGGREIHNETKNRNGIGTYDTVLKNIDYALSKHLKVNIRCNYTSHNIASFRNLVDDIRGLKHLNTNFVRVSLQRVWQETMTKQLYEECQSLKNYLVSSGFSTDVDGGLCTISYCYADYENSYVINYNGDVFKCTARDFEISNRIGKIDKVGDIVNLNKSYLLDNRFTIDCDDCSLLPICTICSQVHKENPFDGCPKKISDLDKEHQIKLHFDRFLTTNLR